MNRTPLSTCRFRRTVAGCGGVALATGLLALANEATGWRVPESLGGLYVSMVPGVAAAVAALGAALIAVGLWPGRRTVAWFAGIAGAGVALLGGVAIAPLVVRPDSGLGHLLMRALAAVSGGSAEAVSPVTACHLLLVGTATVLLAAAVWRNLAATIAAVVAIAGGVVVLGYLFGTPLLYNSSIRPASLPAALGFVSLGLGLVLASGPDVWLVRPLMGPSVRARLLRIFLPFTLGGIVASDLVTLFFVKQTTANPALVSAVTTVLCLVAAGALVSRVATGVGNAIDRVEAELRRSDRELCALSQRLVEIQEVERRNLSRELHDRVGQSLTALGINLTMVRYQPESGLSEATAARVDDSIELLEDIGRHVEDLMYDLRPPMLDEYGLPTALRWFAEQFSRRTGIATEVEAAADPGRRLSSEAETGLFRVVQEALNNVVKHARAKHVIIRVDEQDKSLVVAVADDGIGLDPAAPVRTGARAGYGLLSMRERARSLGGQLRLESQPGQGTTVSVVLRYPAEGSGGPGVAGKPPPDRA